MKGSKLEIHKIDETLEWAKKYIIEKIEEIDNSRDASIISDYVEKGATLRDTGKKYGITGERVRQICEKHGIPTKPNVRRLVLNEDEKQNIIKLYQEEKPICYIMEKLGYSRSIILEILKERGFQIRSSIFYMRSYKKPTKYPLPRIRRIVKRYKRGDKINMICEEEDITPRTLYSYVDRIYPYLRRTKAGE